MKNEFGENNRIFFVKKWHFYMDFFKRKKNTNYLFTISRKKMF